MRRHRTPVGASLSSVPPCCYCCSLPMVPYGPHRFAGIAVADASSWVCLVDALLAPFFPAIDASSCSRARLLGKVRFSRRHVREGYLTNIHSPTTHARPTYLTAHCEQSLNGTFTGYGSSDDASEASTGKEAHRSPKRSRDGNPKWTWDDAVNPTPDKVRTFDVFVSAAEHTMPIPAEPA